MHEAAVGAGIHGAHTRESHRPFLDFNGDGLINSIDNLQFCNRFNKALVWRV